MAAGLILALAGCNSATVKPVKDAQMTESSKTLWQTIDALAQQIPLTQEKVERVLDITLFDTDPRTLVFQPTSFRPLEGGPVVLANGVVIENVDLRVKYVENDPGFLVLNFAGTCVHLDAVRAHYDGVRITATPRALSAFHSLDETTSHSTMLSWGKLSFLFAERNPECLSSVVLAPHGS